jgi:hypothetical protein
VKRHLERLRGTFDRLPRRDRHLLALAVLALVAMFELLSVWPLRERRLAAESATGAEIEQLRQAEADRVADLQLSRETLHAELARIDAELQRLGAAHARGETLSALIARALAGHDLQLRSLRALPVEDLAIEADAPAPDAAAAPEAAAAAPAMLLYRHRVELKISGPALPLLQSIDKVARGLKPLRIERVAVTPAGGGAEATLTLATIGTEPAWIEL